MYVLGGEHSRLDKAGRPVLKGPIRAPCTLNERRSAQSLVTASVSNLTFSAAVLFRCQLAVLTRYRAGLVLTTTRRQLEHVSLPGP